MLADDALETAQRLNRVVSIRDIQLAALRAVVEKYRVALDGLYALVQHETDLPKGAANGVVSDSGTDEGVWRAGEIIENARLALTFDRQTLGGQQGQTEPGGEGK
jgi:hypothetical protein